MKTNEIPEKVLKEWAELTDINQHELVREEIAKYLAEHFVTQFAIYQELFHTLRTSVEQKGFMLCGGPNQVDELKVECVLTDSMMTDVERLLGTECAESINHCL